MSDLRGISRLAGSVIATLLSDVFEFDSNMVENSAAEILKTIDEDKSLI